MDKIFSDGVYLLRQYTILNVARPTRILNLICLFLFLSIPQLVQGQTVIEKYQPAEGLLRIGPEPERAIQMTEKGYTLVLPEGSSKPAGIVIFPDGWKVDLSKYLEMEGSFEYESITKNLALLHITTGNPLDFYFDKETLNDVVIRIQAVLDSHNLMKIPIFIEGMSLGGTRALKLAIHLVRNREKYRLIPAAVAIIDAPLDMERFWGEEKRASRINFHPAAADEGRWVTYLLEKNLGGTPRDNYDAYVRYSPFTYSADDGGNAVYLKDIAVRAYHEPDINWWIENRRKSYYSMNSLDQAALINELKIQGSEKAELVTTHQMREGYKEGSSPHTWTIVNNAELVEWFLVQGGKAK